MVRKFRKRSSLVALKRFVYLISPSKINHSFYENLDKVLSSNNIKFFQLRLKKISKKKIILISKKIKKITKKYRVNFIINDDPIIAKIVNADGCHLGQTDMDLTLARKYMGKKIIGITCHGSKKLILKATKKKPNYLALGSFFKSRLKPKTKIKERIIEMDEE